MMGEQWDSSGFTLSDMAGWEIPELAMEVSGWENHGTKWIFPSSHV